MCARIFYGSYNAVAMHRVVMCKSSGDKHIDSSAWAGSGSRRCFTEMMGLALQGAAWLQGCLSPAQGMGHRLSSHPHRLSCGQCKEQSKVPLASQLGHKCHSRSRSCSKSEIIFHCHITKSVLQRWNLTSIYTGLWCDQRALVWRERCSQCWMSFWEAQLHPTLGAFNSNKMSKAKDRNLHSALPL